MSSEQVGSRYLLQFFFFLYLSVSTSNDTAREDGFRLGKQYAEM